MNSRSMLSLIEKCLDDNQAIDIVSIDLEGKTAIADSMVVASGRSSRHVGAMADHLLERLRKEGVKGVLVEGQKHCDWVLIDAGEVVGPLFRPEGRAFSSDESRVG